MARYLVVATAGAGGDLQPLVAAALALKDQGHELVFLGEDAVARLVGPLGIDARTLPREAALGPRLANLVRAATAAAGGSARLCDPSSLSPLPAGPRRASIATACG